jgi:ketosteroid isomerase-like protein
LSTKERQVDGRQIIETLLNAIGRQDRSTFTSMVEEDVEWSFPQAIAALSSWPQPVCGREAVLAILMPGRTPVFRPGTTTWHFHHVVQQGDLVAAHVERESTTAAGSPYRVEYHWLAQLREGKVAKVWDVMDTRAALEQISAAPG